MSSKLSVEEVLANLERRAVFHREQETVHAEQEIHHREQRELHAAELTKVLQSLESFRAVAAEAVDLARLPVAKPVPAAAEEKIPPPGRLRISRMLRLAVFSADLEEPFGATALAKAANRRFAGHLEQPVGLRTASDVLRRMLAEGEVQLAREGKAFHEALYSRRARPLK